MHCDAVSKRRPINAIVWCAIHNVQYTMCNVYNIFCARDAVWCSLKAAACQCNCVMCITQCAICTIHNVQLCSLWCSLEAAAYWCNVWCAIHNVMQSTMYISAMCNAKCPMCNVWCATYYEHFILRSWKSASAVQCQVFQVRVLTTCLQESGILYSHQHLLSSKTNCASVFLVFLITLKEVHIPCAVFWRGGKYIRNVKSALLYTGLL